MTPEKMNAAIKDMISKMDEIGAWPSYTKGGNYNDFVEYERLNNLIAERCIEAFKAGYCFRAEETP